MLCAYRLVGIASLLANGAALWSRDATGAPTPAGAAQAAVERQADGLFHLPGQRGGRQVTFVVDTGASVTVLTAADAVRLGAAPLPGHAPAMLATAGGRAELTWSRLPPLTIAGRRVGALEVAVVQDGIGRSLLGQDALTQLGTLVITGDRLTIR